MMRTFFWTPYDVARLQENADAWRKRAQVAETEIARRDTIDEDYPNALQAARLRASQSEKLLEAAKVSRTPEGMEKLSRNVALKVDDIYAGGFGGGRISGPPGMGAVEARRKAVVLAVTNALTVALTGGNPEFY